MKNRLTPIFRLARINYVLAKHGVDRILFSMPIFYSLRFLSYFNPWNWHRYHARSRGARIRESLEDLGPIFVKFGQTLSTRRDLLPDDIADELAKLQDCVPPFPTAIVKKIIVNEYKKPLSELFLEFDDTPLAAASIAQVHAATLHDNKKVIVKILRPGVHKIIQRDIELLYAFASLAERYWPGSHRLKPREVVAEFEKTLTHELNLMREAANASQLRRNFIGSNLLYIPEVHWRYARHRVLVMERIEGVPISNTQELVARGINLKQLSERGVEIFFTQVFRDCFFHADMHPGNIFVDTATPDNPRYLAVDFGIMGTLNSSDQRYLAENMLAFFHRDYRRVAELHVESGWVPAYTRIDEFEAAIRTVCEPMFEQPLKDISCGKMLLHLFQAASHFHMEIQPQLVLLQKTLLNIEGLGRQLYPDLDLWHTAKPFLEHWIKKQLGVRTLLRKIRSNIPYWLEKLPEIPDLIYQTLHAAKDNKLQQELREVQHKLQISELRQLKRGNFWKGFGLAVVIIIVVVGALHFTHPTILRI